MSLLAQDVMAIAPAGDPLIFVDHEVFRPQLAIGPPVVPFLESEGQYGGAPPDEVTAVAELAWLRRSGANFIVLTWPTFRWLDYYEGLADHLRSRYPCVHTCELSMVRNLRL